MSITLKARTIVKGNVEARAIVAKKAMSFTYVDPETGKVIDTTQELYGETIKDKILVLPVLKGSAMQPYSLYQLLQKGVAPRGLITLEAETRIISAAMLCEIPLMDKLEKNPLEAIRTGDLVRLRADKGVVEVER